MPSLPVPALSPTSRKEMKKLVIALSLIAAVSSPASLSAQSAASATEGFTLVWQDLFDGDALNRNRWNIEVNGAGGGNNELQYYTDRPENVCVENGCLVLTARREQYLGKNFTSGRVNSKNLIAFTHGMLEASIKLPKTANGLWPAFWMMGNDFDQVGWPRCGETDIVEMGNADGIKAGSQERFFNGACHWGQGWPAASYAKSSSHLYSLQDGEFHLFTVVWDENRVLMYVDRDKYPKYNPYYKLDFPQTEPDNEWSPGNYFHKDNFILFNLAVGGDFTGIHQADNITALNEANGNSSAMYVDYVKIYQKGAPSEHTDFHDAGDPLDSGGIQSAELTDDGEIHEIIFDGDLLTSTDPQLSLFTAAGRCVAKSASGQISTKGMTPGIYVASNRHCSRKVLIKL